MAITLYPFLITCVICYGIFHYVMWHFRRRRLYVLASRFDGPPALPFIGNAHQALGNSEHILKILTHYAKLYPSPLRMWLGPRLVIIFTDPDNIKAVCLSSKLLEKGEMFVDVTRPLVTGGLVTAPAAIWKVHRRLIQPSFNTKILDSFVEIFSTQSKIMADKMERNLNGSEFEIMHMSLACTLDMICETAMGVRLEAQKGKGHDYPEAAQKALATMNERIFSLWLHPDFIFHRTQTGKLQHKSIQCMHDVTDNVIRLKKKELSNGESRLPTTDDENDAYSSRSWRKVFLDHLMALPEDNNLSDRELRDEIHTMVVAGSETSGLTTSYTLLMLASHPDIQEKVYQELHEIYGNDEIDDHPVTPEDLPRMKYLERVIKETLRLFPSIPFIVREVIEEVNIGDHTLPKGSTAAIGIISVQRDEKYWPDPLTFNPDRFLPEEMAKRSPYAFMAFSAGPRNCIGVTQGLMAVKTLIATVLRRYILKKDKIVPVKDIRLKMEIALKPVEPLTLRIERRNRN